MEPRAGAAEAVGSDPAVGFRTGARLVAACAVLVGLAMTQSPGLVVADTKVDLVFAPGRFLARALHLWDPLAAFGQLQNQAYGYLWPMGPFFLAGDALDLPGWVVQRLWLALVMCVALVGAACLARAFGMRSDLAVILTGFAYALSPRMLTTLGPISIEAWPSALAPWVLLPLVVGSRRGSPIRAAALAGLAVAMVGGVNAAATFAVLPLGVVWLLTRTPGPRRRSMMLWWPVFTLLGTLWWLVPLFVLGAYSPPFLDYIETATVTTFPTTLFDALRGTSDWVPYVDPSWSAGNDLLREFYLPLNSGVVLMLGLVGLLSRRTPHRVFLAVGVLTGLALVTAGHVGVVSGWGAADLHSVLDGVLAPFRNVHKFDPVVRLPMVLGLGFAVDGLRAQTADGRSGARQPDLTMLLGRVNRVTVVGAAVLAVLGSALPVVAGRVAPPDGAQSIPRYWSDAARWLADRGDSSTTLLVPGSSFGDYVWGFTRDEPMQWLAESPWAIRNAVPLAPPGNIRMLDAVEERLAQGAPSEGLAAFLRRAGVGYLLVRNDLSRSGDVPDPVLVHRALDASPGIRRVAGFGPEVGGGGHLKADEGRLLVNGGWQDVHRALEVYAVSGEVRRALTVDSPSVVVGGPEDLLALQDLGVLGSAPVRLAVDTGGRPGPDTDVVLTDGLRAVERHFGRVHDAASATLGAGQVRRLATPTRDYVLDRGERWSTTARLYGLRRLSASSSRSDATTIGGAEPGRMPFAAVDGEPSTSWVSNREDRPAWWQLDFDGQRVVSELTLTGGAGDSQVVRVITSKGSSAPISLPAATARTVDLGSTVTDYVRVEDASGRPGSRLSLSEVVVPGVDAQRTLVTPRLPAGWAAPDRIVLRAVRDARTGCATVDATIRCVAGRQAQSEEPFGFDRAVPLPTARSYAASLAVVGRPGESLERLLTRRQPLGISGSSRAVPDERSSPLAAVDGDPGTAWAAGPEDVRPVLELNWLGKRLVRGVRVTVGPDLPVRAPTHLRLRWSGGQRDVRLDDRGRATFRPIRTDGLTMQVMEAEPGASLDFDGAADQIPVGIGEIRLSGVPMVPLVLPRRALRFRCETGPTVTVNGVEYRTRLRASPQDLYDGRPVRATLCGRSTLSLRAGTNHVGVQASDAFVPVALDLDDSGGAALTGSVATDGPHAVRQQLVPSRHEGTIALRQNANPGWRALQGDKALVPEVADGWQSAWRLVGSDEKIALEFVADTPYRAGMLGGLLALVLMLAVVLAPRDRWQDRRLVPIHDRHSPAVGVVLLAAAAGGVLAGWSGAAVALVGLVTGAALLRSVPDSAPWVIGGLVLVPALAYALRPWAGGEGWAGALAWPHYFVVLALSGVLGGLLPETRRRPRFLSRIPGFSTRR